MAAYVRPMLQYPRVDPRKIQVLAGSTGSPAKLQHVSVGWCRVSKGPASGSVPDVNLPTVSRVRPQADQTTPNRPAGLRFRSGEHAASDRARADGTKVDLATNGSKLSLAILTMGRFFVATNFVQTLRPVYYLTKAIGLISFTANFDTIGSRRDFKDVVSFVGFLFFNSILALNAALTPTQRNMTYFDSSLIQFIFSLFLSLQLVALIVIPVVNYLNAKKFDRLVRHIVEVDEGLGQLGYEHDYSEEYFYSTMYLTVSLILQIICLTGTAVSNPFLGQFDTVNNVLIMVTFTMCNLVYIMSCCYCCTSLWAIVYRYHKINATFRIRAISFQLRSFSIQLSHQAPKASCYFYDIDWSFLLTMISSFASYLNILVQFDIIQFRATSSWNNNTVPAFNDPLGIA
uniref:Gustatory receptor n=1 Tax=Anopheles farauti TaxID=69004 RepID=A0A182Q3V6_9DIPT